MNIIHNEMTFHDCECLEMLSRDLYALFTLPPVSIVRRDSVMNAGLRSIFFRVLFGDAGGQDLGKTG